MIRQQKNILLILFLVFFASCQSTEKEIHLIPEGFVGRVMIFFERDDGSPEKYENGARLYEVPENGILKTTFDLNEGFQQLNDIQFFYVNEKGDRKPINQRWTKNPDSKVILHPSTIEVFGTTVGVANDSLVYLEYVIDRISEADNYKGLTKISEYVNSDQKLPKQDFP